MENILLELIYNHFSYLALFVGILFCGLILFFIPEEVFLLSVGYLAYSGFGNLYLMIFVTLIAAIFNDNIIYYIFKKYGSDLADKIGNKFKIFKKIKNYTENYFNNHGDKTVFISRFFQP